MLAASVARYDARKANASETSERCALIEERLTTFAQQCSPMGAELQQLSGRLDRLEVTSGPAGEAKRVREMEELSRSLSTVSSQTAELRAASRAQRQQLTSMLAGDQTQQAALAEVEARLAQVTSMAEEQARYLVAVGDALHEKHIPAPKFRSAALALPSFASLGAAAQIAGSAAVSASGAPPLSTHARARPTPAMPAGLLATAAITAAATPAAGGMVENAAGLDG